MKLNETPSLNSKSDTPRSDFTVKRCNALTYDPTKKDDLIPVSQEGFYIMVNALKKFEREINKLKKLDYTHGLKFNPIVLNGSSTLILMCKQCKKILNNGSFCGILDYNSDRFNAYLCMSCGHKSLYTMDYATLPLVVGTWEQDDNGKMIPHFDKPDPTHSWPDWKKRLANMDSNCNDCAYKGESPISGDHCKGCRNGNNHSER
jgi:hypothetical protein